MKELKKQISKLWWDSIFTSLIFLIVGIMLILKPTEIITMISMVVGIGIMIAGIFAFVKYFKIKEKNFRFDFIYGVICIVSGILLVLNPEAVASVLPLVLGIWMVIHSMMKIEYILTLSKNHDISFWITTILTVLTLASGILFIFNPFKGAAILTQILGSIITFYALMDVINAFVLRKSVKKSVGNTIKIENETIQEAIIIEDEE